MYDGRREEVAVEVSNGRRGNNPDFSRLAATGFGGTDHLGLAVRETGGANNSSPVMVTSHPRGYALLVGRII